MLWVGKLDTDAFETGGPGGGLGLAYSAKMTHPSRYCWKNKDEQVRPLCTSNGRLSTLNFAHKMESFSTHVNELHQYTTELSSSAASQYSHHSLTALANLTLPSMPFMPSPASSSVAYLTNPKPFE